MEDIFDPELEDAFFNGHKLQVIEYQFMIAFPNRLKWLGDLKDEFKRLKKLRKIYHDLTKLRNEYIRIEKLKIKFYDGEPGEIVDLKPLVECWDDMTKKKEFDTLFVYNSKLSEVSQHYLELLDKLSYLYPEKTALFNKELKSKSGSVNENPPSTVSEDGKPVFNKNILNQLLQILNPHFSKEHHKKLRSILESGNDVTQKLYFKDNGNRLADAFKKLYEADLITGVDKMELESWIANYFDFRHRGKRKKYKLRYLSDIISTTEEKCKNPLLKAILNNESGKYLLTKVEKTRKT